jgi:V/A-type H+-transporting ATPase subunit A
MAEARIRWIGGPVLHAVTEGAFHLGEAIEVGAPRLPGEVIRLRERAFVAQVYEDTTGLKPGDPVYGTGQPLSVPLGPGLLGNIYDGLLRPLAEERIVEGGEDDTITFCPRLSEGDEVKAGQVFGDVTMHGIDEPCLVPPDLSGTVEEIAAEGETESDATLLKLRGADGETHEIGLNNDWPVRRPRPVRERLPGNKPLITGQRILDTLFPIARGSRAAIPGGFGTGKTVLQETLAKHAHADVIVYVGCGERGNEMAEVLNEFPELTDPRTDRPLMERTVIIANTSNMPVAAREASIYAGVTVAEYFRDQGKHVALMADSTSRWAEALREVSGRLGELPAEAGYPAYLSSRLADFYERAARVTALNGEEGSLTIIGAVSPPAGDFSEPVTSHTKRYIRCFWGLDRERAQARFYPAIHPLQSYSEDAQKFTSWWTEQGNSDWYRQRERLLTLLEREAHLQRMARIVGKDALPADQQLTLTCADLVNEALLSQSAFSKTDRYCSPERQTEMLRLVIRFIDLAFEALERGADPEDIASLSVYRRLQRMGEEIGEDEIERFDDLRSELDDQLGGLEARETQE